MLVYPGLGLLVFLSLTAMFSAYQNAELDRTESSLRHQLMERRMRMAQAARLLEQASPPPRSGKGGPRKKAGRL